MIEKVELNMLPALPGECRSLLVYSDSSPILVAIECFRQPPRPPELRACAECGSYQVESGIPIEIIVPKSTFKQGDGFVRIDIQDQSGDRDELILKVKRIDRSGGLMHAN